MQTQLGGQPFGQLMLAGRPSPGGPVDDLVLNAGHWADGPGQVVLDGIPAQAARAAARRSAARSPSPGCRAARF